MIGRSSRVCLDQCTPGARVPSSGAIASREVLRGLPEREKLPSNPWRCKRASAIIRGNSPEGSPTMESSEIPIRVLVVAHKTAATQPLLDAVRERAGHGPCTFTLLVPNATHGLHKIVDPEDQDAGEANAVIDHALPLLSEAAGTPVEGIVGAPDPGAAVQDAINRYGFDEVIISTLPTRLSRWLKLDLPSKVSGTGLPVTTVTPSEMPAT